MPRKSIIHREAHGSSDPRSDLANIARMILRIFRPSQRENSLTAAHCLVCLAMLLCLTASGCVALDAKESTSPAPVVTVPPDEKKLAELANTAFATAKLSTAPEISPVRAAHDTQLGDWVFCIRGRDADQMREYAVLIRDNKVSELRSSVLIDGCHDETYRPIEITSQGRGSGKTNVKPSTQSRSRPQTSVPQ
jgi:hypothetical protein